MITYTDPPKDLNQGPRGKTYQQEYQDYVQHCKIRGVEPRSWYDWYYCTYSAFEESWRLSH